MMESIILAVTLLTASPQVQASDDFYPSDFYSSVNQAYRLHSKRPAVERMIGWYSGRCASSSNPDKKVAALLTVFQDGGTLKAVFWRETQQASSFYDRLTPELIASIEESIKKYGAGFPPMMPHRTYWEAIHTGEHKDSTLTQADKNNIIVQAFHDDVQTTACLFFKKVR